MSLKVDGVALDQARADLGLSLDVRVIFDRLTCSRSADSVMVQGRYTGVDPFHSWHNVWVHQHLTTQTANAVLWHEMVHALQCERLGSYAAFDRAYSEQQRAVPYPYGTPDYFNSYRAWMPFEQEAWAHTDLARQGILSALVYAD